MDILLTTYNRPQYLIETYNSLLKTQFDKKEKIWLFDDCSNDKNTIDIISDINRYLNSEVTVRPENLGVDRNNYKSIQEIFNRINEDFVFILDSDVILNSEWYLYAKKYIEWMKKDDKMGIICLYNSIWARTKQKSKEYPELEEKFSLGGCGSIIRREIFNKIDFKKRKAPWDVVYRQKCLDLELKLYCSRISYLQHIGEYGCHAHPERFYDYSVSYL